MITIGCTIAAVFLLLSVLAASGFLAWKLIASEPEIETPPPPPNAPSKLDPRELVGELVNFDLHAGDPTVQWVRLTNADGKRILTARPDADAKITVGSYSISAKVVAREGLTGEISITEDTSISCKPATMGRIRCTEPNGNTRLLLKP